MDKKYTYGLAGLLLGGLIVWFLTTNPNASGWRIMGNSNEFTQNRGMMNSSVIDSHFIEQMIPHHEDAIAMAKIALEKGTHPEIKTLAQNIITSQTSENEKMTTWYKQWFGRELPVGEEVMNIHGMMSRSGGMHMGMMGDEADLEALENALDFDKAFIEEMIPHHQMAVMMASMLKNGTNRPEMKQLANDIITAQTKEIDQMRQWYKEWSN